MLCLAGTCKEMHEGYSCIRQVDDGMRVNRKKERPGRLSTYLKVSLPACLSEEEYTEEKRSFLV